jgi:hypothetical protein
VEVTGPEKPLDVSKEAIQRLMAAAKTEYDKAHEGQVRVEMACYWDGYIRGLELVLEMEDQ